MLNIEHTKKHTPSKYLSNTNRNTNFRIYLSLNYVDPSWHPKEHTKYNTNISSKHTTAIGISITWWHKHFVATTSTSNRIPANHFAIWWRRLQLWKTKISAATNHTFQCIPHSTSTQTHAHTPNRSIWYHFFGIDPKNLFTITDILIHLRSQQKSIIQHTSFGLFSDSIFFCLNFLSVCLPSRYSLSLPFLFFIRSIIFFHYLIYINIHIIMCRYAINVRK